MQPIAFTKLQEVLGILIHDLRQPLNTIEDATSCLRLLIGERDPAVDAQLRLIERQIEMAARSLADLSAQIRREPQRAGSGESLDLTKSQTAVVT